MKTKIRSSSIHRFGRPFAALLLALAGSMATGLHAATNTVTSTADDGSAGTLRAVLAAAADGDTIDARGISGTITLLPQFLTSSQLGITKSVTILGSGPANLTINGNGTSRVFLIFPDHAVTIEGITIANGRAAGAPPGSFPPSSGGGIFNDHSTLTLRNCVISQNSAEAEGGGIFSEGISSLTLENCIFNLNSAFDGGGIGSNFRATVTVMACTFSENFVEQVGGAIHANAFESSIKVINSTFSQNSASSGGAIRLSSGPMDVINSTFVGNTADFAGGIDNFGDTRVANCTFSGNTAANLGGGMTTGPSRTMNVFNSTFSGNTAGEKGGHIFASGELHIGSTILRAGSPENIFDNGVITSHGFNLSSDAADGDGGTGPGGFLNSTGDQRNTDPMLGPLANNGGPTLTHLPLPGSPAIDQGTSDTLLVFGITTDQRDSARTVDDLNIANAFLGDGTDIGAVELAAPNNAPVAKCKNVTVLAGPDGLANASIDDGSSDPDSGDAITVVQDPPGPYPTGTTSVTLTVTDSNGASSSCTATVTVQGVADLAISKAVVSGHAKPGQLLIYTTVVTNLGPNPAAVVVINDAVPQGTTFVSASPSPASVPPVGAGGTVVWNGGTLANGASASFTLTVKVSVKGNNLIVNTANVTSSSSDPNPANNTATVTSKRQTK